MWSCDLHLCLTCYILKVSDICRIVFTTLFWAAVYNKSKIQATVATIWTEDEFMAAVSGAKAIFKTGTYKLIMWQYHRNNYGELQETNMEVPTHWCASFFPPLIGWSKTIDHWTHHNPTKCIWYFYQGSSMGTLQQTHW